VSTADSHPMPDWSRQPDRTWVDRATGEVADFDTMQGLETGRRLDEHEDLLEALVVQLEALYGADSMASRTGRPSRWSWHHARAQERAELWHELHQWVEWLIDRYELQVGPHHVPPCWYAHPVAVEELTALMSAWRSAYCAGDAASVELIQWNQTFRGPTLERLQRTAHWQNCEPDRHRQPTRAVGTDGGFVEFRDSDLATRQSGLRGDPLASRRPGLASSELGTTAGGDALVL
jgi:hypothetical protein